MDIGTVFQILWNKLHLDHSKTKPVIYVAIGAIAGGILGALVFPPVGVALTALGGAAIGTVGVALNDKKAAKKALRKLVENHPELLTRREQDIIWTQALMDEFQVYYNEYI